MVYWNFVTRIAPNFDVTILEARENAFDTYKLNIFRYNLLRAYLLQWKPLKLYNYLIILKIITIRSTP